MWGSDDIIRSLISLHRSLDFSIFSVGSFIGSLFPQTHKMVAEAPELISSQFLGI